MKWWDEDAKLAVVSVAIVLLGYGAYKLWFDPNRIPLGLRRERIFTDSCNGTAKADRSYCLERAARRLEAYEELDSERLRYEVLLNECLGHDGGKNRHASFWIEDCRERALVGVVQ